MANLPRCRHGRFRNDQDDVELIARLCTKIGTIMKDASVVAITTPEHPSQSIDEKLAYQVIASNAISALVAAATAVVNSTD